MAGRNIVVDKVYLIAGSHVNQIVYQEKSRSNVLPNVLFVEFSLNDVANRLFQYIKPSSIVYYPYSVEIMDRYGRTQYDGQEVLRQNISTLRIVNDEDDYTLDIYTREVDNMSTTTEPGLLWFHTNPEMVEEYETLRNLLKNKIEDKGAKFVTIY